MGNLFLSRVIDQTLNLNHSIRIQELTHNNYPMADQLVASTLKCLELLVLDMWGWNRWMTCMSKTEWQHKRIASWMCSIKTSLSIGILYRTKISSMSMSITKCRPTTIWWLDHMTMLNACAEAHAFATLMLWKGGIWLHDSPWNMLSLFPYLLHKPPSFSC